MQSISMKWSYIKIKYIHVRLNTFTFFLMLACLFIHCKIAYKQTTCIRIEAKTWIPNAYEYSHYLIQNMKMENLIWFYKTSNSVIANKLKLIEKRNSNHNNHSAYLCELCLCSTHFQLRSIAVIFYIVQFKIKIGGKP